MRTLVLAAIAFGLATSGAVQARDLTRLPSRIGGDLDNLDFALAEICEPFLFDKEPAEALLDRPFVVKKSSGGPVAAQMEGLTSYMIGHPQGVVLAIGPSKISPGQTQCIISAEDGDAAALRALVLRRFAARPEGFALSKSAPPAGNYTSRELLCAETPANYFVVISTDNARRKNLPRVILTAMTTATRNPRCDGG